jgi:hypothetical protein
MTHSPEPLSAESLYALSWEAATERLIAASCVPVNEAEAFAAAHAAREASIEVSQRGWRRLATSCFHLPLTRVQINLPPLVEDDETRTVLASTFRKTRDRYRSFRTRLSSEISQSRGRWKLGPGSSASSSRILPSRDDMSWH